MKNLSRSRDAIAIVSLSISNHTFTLRQPIKSKEIGANMKSSLAGLAIATIFLSCLNANAETVAPSPKSFEQWCQQKNSLPAATKKTVEALLKESGTQDCKLANIKLNSLLELNLSGNQISDLKPLAGLSNWLFWT